VMIGPSRNFAGSPINIAEIPRILEKYGLETITDRRMAEPYGATGIFLIARPKPQ
jgi:hypothetical protein